jgi:ubiquitin C-terminal hydrolase
MINRNQQIEIDKRNQQLTYQNFIQEFITYNNSIISDLFYGINCNILRCCNCNSLFYDFHTYFLITFPLEEVYDYKNRIIKMQSQVNNSNYIQNNYNSSNINQSNASNNNYTFYQQNQINNKTMIYNNYEINIYDCFEFYRRVNFYDGDNSMYCDYCKANSNFYLCKNLISGPKILIISLNNGKAKSKIKFNFSDKLNLYNYILNKNSGFMYKLIGVITHIDMGGFFIAYCMDPITNQWNKYNDAIVTEVKDFQNEIINFAMPYLLFYQKLNA